MDTLFYHIDPVIGDLIEREQKRQEDGISLIASENYAPPAILQAVGSVLTNKYAEGTVGKRYYAGCAVVDAVEELAQKRCCDLFGSTYANVQPHSGSQANMAAYSAFLKPGDTILGLGFNEGGHLTHGHPRNFSGKLYRCISYPVDRQTEQIDYQELERLAQEHRPQLIVAGASAYARTLDFARFSQIARSVDARLMVDMAHIAGLVAAGLHPTPVGHADIITSTTHKTLRGPRGAFILADQEHAELIDRSVMPGIQGGPFMHVIAAKAIAFFLAKQPAFVEYQKQVIRNAQKLAQALVERGYRIVSGGTDTHLFIVDLRTSGLDGKTAEEKLEKIGIQASRSCIPFDEQKPWIGSGIRFGTAAVTTRGMREPEMEQIADMVHAAWSGAQEIGNKPLRDAVHTLARSFFIYHKN